MNPDSDLSNLLKSNMFSVRYHNKRDVAFCNFVAYLPNCVDWDRPTNLSALEVQMQRWAKSPGPVSTVQVRKIRSLKLDLTPPTWVVKPPPRTAVLLLRLAQETKSIAHATGFFGTVVADDQHTTVYVDMGGQIVARLVSKEEAEATKGWRNL